MKKYLFPFICLLAIEAVAQKEFDLGLVVRGNLSTQTTHNPSKPEDGTFQWNGLPTFGVGAYAGRQIKGNFHIFFKALYLQKGFKENADYGSIAGVPIFGSTTFQNYFNYISFDWLGRYYLSKKNIRPYGFGGLQSSFLVSKKLESDIFPNNAFYPMSDYGDFKPNSNSWILGFGLDMNKMLSIEAEVNRDFTPVIDKDSLLVKNWLWSLSMQVSLYNILKK
jgi:hypothetical protein